MKMHTVSLLFSLAATLWRSGIFTEALPVLRQKHPIGCVFSKAFYSPFYETFFKKLLIKLKQTSSAKLGQASM